MSAYLKKLRDPRWQKKRLFILERDNWTCKICNKKDKTLNVHHIIYLPKKEPWEIPNGFLITICEDCHIAGTDENNCTPADNLFEQIDIFLNTFWKNGYNPHDLLDLSCHIKEKPEYSYIKKMILNFKIYKQE